MAAILVVDDSKTIRTIVRTVLEKAGYSVIEAVDGNDALAKFGEVEKIHMVITDINMPNMDGITMCQELKKTDKGKEVPVLIISTEGSPELKSQAKTAGALAWMTKPPQADKLTTTVASVLSKMK